MGQLQEAKGNGIKDGFCAAASVYAVVFCGMWAGCPMYF